MCLGPKKIILLIRWSQSTHRSLSLKGLVKKVYRAFITDTNQIQPFSLSPPWVTPTFSGQGPAFCHTGHNKRVNSSADYWLERARRDLSNGGVYLEAQVSWRAQREIFACGGGAICSQRGQISALGLPGAPLIARRCSAIAPEHFATIGGHVGSAAGDLALRPRSPCPWVRPQPPTRHSQARLAVCFALPSPQCSPHHRRAFRAMGIALAEAQQGQQ